ncbi:hypothetical protein LLE49_20555 [Alicyclobacillus tolerans]|uniref:hypothetical protein n=1 Tax=Alicyclobacillus tolerans TaxID=90970 RepID=UPI001F40B362|nr:hypothetical protein [Alicyclobacillus tolerans]MCF8567113.1 hypothetical protein [Alicyclobacillus tolerans]
MEQLFVVWYSNGAGWRPSKSMSKSQAERFAESLAADGYKVGIYPRPNRSWQDILED